MRSFASRCAALDEIDRPINTGASLLPERHSSCHVTLPATLSLIRITFGCDHRAPPFPPLFFLSRYGCFYAEKSTRRWDIIQSSPTSTNRDIRPETFTQDQENGSEGLLACLMDARSRPSVSIASPAIISHFALLRVSPSGVSRRQTPEAWSLLSGANRPSHRPHPI